MVILDDKRYQEMFQIGITLEMLGVRQQRECWINVYKWWNSYTNEYQLLQGTEYFRAKESAVFYIPSWGLNIAYRIHVRMKREIAHSKEHSLFNGQTIMVM